MNCLLSSVLRSPYIAHAPARQLFVTARSRPTNLPQRPHLVSSIYLSKWQAAKHTNIKPELEWIKVPKTPQEWRQMDNPPDGHRMFSNKQVWEEWQQGSVRRAVSTEVERPRRVLDEDTRSELMIHYHLRAMAMDMKEIRKGMKEIRNASEEIQKIMEKIDKRMERTIWMLRAATVLIFLEVGFLIYHDGELTADGRDAAMLKKQGSREDVDA